MMNENDKDWDNPVFFRIYSALAVADIQNDKVHTWLNENGFANLTVCPVCRIDDFVHSESCWLANAIDKAEVVMNKHKDQVEQEMAELLTKGD